MAKFVKEKGKKGETEKSDVGARTASVGGLLLLFFTTEVHLVVVPCCPLTNSKAPLEMYNDGRQVRS